MSDPFAELKEITELLHMKNMNVYRQRVMALNSTDGKLGEIKRLREAAQADTESVDARRMIGADTNWQGWLAVRAAQLQQERAINTALVMEGMEQSRTSFSRVSAVQNLIDEQRAAKKEKAAKRQEETLQWLSVMQAWGG